MNNKVPAMHQPRLPCPYEKSIQSRVCGCKQANRRQLAGRESISCGTEEMQQHCKEMMNLMRAKSNFAFGLTHTPGALPHSKAIKIQCGGLFGLRAVLDHTDDSSLINDISALIRRARRRFGELGQLPYDRIMRAVIHYQHRKPLRRNKV